MAMITQYSIKRALAALLTFILAAGWASAQAQNAVEQVSQALVTIQASETRFNAVTELNPEAKTDALQVDKLPPSANKLLLRGIPILVKDNIDVKGMATTAGSLALLTNYPSRDAPLTAQLKQQGAVILGKANLSEWANFRSEKSSSGWSAVGGQTYNAVDASRSPCGSSAGSGVAVAAGYVPVAIGTETNGSIVCPASINGVVGFKPTHGLVSGAGIVPLALSQDTAGPIANSVDNAALTLAAMINPQADQAEQIIDGLRRFASGSELDGLRIGVMASSRNFDARRDALLDRAIAKLKAAGVEIIEDLSVELPDSFWADSYQLLQYEFKRDLNDYFKQREYQSTDNSLSTMTLAKLIEFNKANSSTELKHFDQDIFEKSEALSLSRKEYRRIFDGLKKATRDNGLDKLFKQHKLNAIIGTTTGPAWKIDHVNGDSFFGPSMSTLPAIGGHPHITVPNGRIADLPVGLSFIGKRYQDHVLAQLVYRYSQLAEPR